MAGTAVRNRSAHVRWAGALAVAAGLALAGCGGSDTPSVSVDDEGKDRTVSVEGDGGSVTVEEGKDGGITVEGEDGSTFSADTSGDLPDGWPKAVPVIAGTITFAQSSSDGSTGQLWSVTVDTEGSVTDVFDAAKADLEGAGFTASAEVSTADGAFASFSGNGYDVQLTVGAGDGSTTVAYIVTPSA